MADQKKPDDKIEEAEVVDDTTPKPETDPEEGTGKPQDSGADTAEDPAEGASVEDGDAATTDPVAEETADPMALADDPGQEIDFAPPAEDAAAEHDIVEDDHHNSSLSARVLRGLALIAAGIVLALWGAPRLAPLLPAGLSPVAEFLMPGQTEARAEVAALRAEVDERLANLPQASGDVTSEDLAKAIEAYDANLQEDLSTIKDQLAAFDGEDIGARLSAVETKLQGVSAELTSVSERLSKQITENGVALSEEAGTRLSEYQAALEGLRAEVADLSSKNGALSQKVDEVARIAARRVEEAEAEASNKVATTATKRRLTEIGAALDSGSPFAEALNGLTDLTGNPAPEPLAAVAETGTPSWTTLRNRFADTAHAALQADAKANAGDGLSGRLGAFMRTQIGTRSLERREGDNADAILSRVEDDLANRRLDAAVAEAESLPDAARAAMEGWIADLRALSSAQTALSDLTASLDAS